MIARKQAGHGPVGARQALAGAEGERACGSRFVCHP
jgi:hypothetical protein